MVVLDLCHILVAFGEEFVVVKVASVAWDAVVVAHVDCLCHLFSGNECLVEFLSVSCSDDLYLCFSILRFNL